MDILTNGNTKDMSNTSVGIEVKIFLHDAISRFSVMLHNFFICFSVRTWDHCHIIHLFLGIKCMYNLSCIVVAVNSRDRYEIIGFYKISHFMQQPCRNVCLEKAL